MLRKKNIIIYCVLIVIIASLWTWRYVTLNQYYSSLSKSSIEYYNMYEEVYFGKDYIEWGVYAEGYTIQVDKFEILDYEEYIKAASFELADQSLEYEKIALVTITLRNHDSTEAGVMLTDISLHGIDCVVGMDWEILTASNPVLEENYGISLACGTEYQLTLPYAISKNSFGSDTWRKLDDYSFYLRVTSFPTQKDIHLSLSN